MKKWLVFYAKNARIGSLPLNDQNLDGMHALFCMSLIQVDLTGTQHWTILSPWGSRLRAAWLKLTMPASTEKRRSSNFSAPESSPYLDGCKGSAGWPLFLILEDCIVYQPSDDCIRRRCSGFRSLNDTPAVREWLEAEKARKAARKARKDAAATEPAGSLKVPRT